MTADFFCRKLKKGVLFIACAILAFGGAYAIRLAKSEYLAVDFDCYFLCVADGGVEACAAQVAIDGGAGYVFEETVVLSTYFEKEEAQNVQEKVKSRYPSACIKKLSVDEILVREDEKHTVRKKFENIYTHVRAISSIADALEEGLSQEKAKSRLESLSCAFGALRATYPHKAVQAICDTAKTWIEGKRAGIIYVGELRRLVCELAVAFNGALKAESL